MNRLERRRRGSVNRKAKPPGSFRHVVDVRRESGVVLLVCPGCSETIASVADTGQDDDTARRDTALEAAFREHQANHEFKCYAQMGAVLTG